MRSIYPRVIVAVLAIGAIAVGIAGQVVPAIPSWKIIVSTAALAAFFFLLALVHAFISGTIRQQLLRWGAIDPQWLWSPDYPKGFKSLWRRGESEKTRER
jgi:uncharacterized membrane protein